MIKVSRNKRLYYFSRFFILGTGFIIFFTADLLSGSIIIPAGQIISSLLTPDGGGDTYRTILLDFRLPKALTAVFTGAALSLSGLQMQTVFRNPLAGPFVLGISAGASLGVALFVMGFSTILSAGVITATGSLSMALVAWAGSFLVLLLILYVSVRVKDIMTILILGILFTSAVSAIVSILQYFSNESLLKHLLYGRWEVLAA
jgi:iron complex transport system permease protein